MAKTTVRTRCECQARLVATLNDQRLVLAASCIDAAGNEEPAPAHSIGAQNDRFDIGWLCSHCGRNVLRSFSASGLLWQDALAPGPLPCPPRSPRHADAGG